MVYIQSSGPTRLRPINNRRLLRRRLKWSVPLVTLLVLGASVGLFFLIVSGKLRVNNGSHTPSASASSTAWLLQPGASTSTQLVPRALDGVLVPIGQEMFVPRGVMIDNQIAARPQSGLSQTSLVIESPVEGGITRLLAFFDATTTPPEIGPVRSSRPYFIDWAQGWHAMYFHVGGSPDALNHLQALGKTFGNVDQIASALYFWRSPKRSAPHNVYTNQPFMTQALIDGGLATSTSVVAWHFVDASTSTMSAHVSSINVGYPGDARVTWKFDPSTNLYRRSQGGKKQNDSDGTPLEAHNVIVIETDGQVLDEKGRLSVRTIGSGSAIAYRDGNRYAVRWSRIANEPIRFEFDDGSEFLFDRGNTWIEVTTNDLMFAGLNTATSTSTTSTP